jgi:hypothetical protein
VKNDLRDKVLQEKGLLKMLLSGGHGVEGRALNNK